MNASSLLVALAQRLENHRVLGLGGLDEVEKILRRVVARGPMTPALVVVAQSRGIKIVAVLVLMLPYRAIVCRVNHRQVLSAAARVKILWRRCLLLAC